MDDTNNDDWYNIERNSIGRQMQAKLVIEEHYIRNYF